MSQAPYLMSSFFQDHPPTADLLSRAPSGPWSDECLPVYEWQGMWFVAVPSEKFQNEDLPVELSVTLPSDCMLIRADAEVIRSAWTALQTKLNDAHQTVDSTTPPEDEVTIPGINPPPVPVKFDEALEAPIRALLDGLKTSFDGAMFLVCSENNVSPIWWTSGFKDAGKKQYEISEPSSFQLVARTLLPFHGQTVPSKAVDTLMKDWLTGPPPSNVTIVPLIEDGRAQAMILCIGTRSTYTRDHLHIVESAAAKATELMLQQSIAA